MNKPAKNVKYRDRLRFLQIALAIVLTLHLVGSGFAIYFIMDRATEEANERLAGHATNLIDYIIVSYHNKSLTLKSELKVLNLSNAQPKFRIQFSTSEPSNTIQIPVKTPINYRVVEKLKKSLSKKNILNVSLYFPRFKEWITITSTPKIKLTTTNILLRIFFAVVMPIGITMIIIFSYFFISRKQLFYQVGQVIEGSKDDKGKSQIAKEVDQEITQLKDKIKKVIDEKTIMILALSHDINTPIAKMQFYLESMRSHELYEQFKKQLLYITNVVDSSFAISKADNEVIQPRKIDVSSSLEALADKHYANNSAVIFSLPDTFVTIAGDPVLLERAIVNLINNALKYANNVNIRFSTTKKIVKIFIEDDGPGIPDDEIRRLLQPFQQLNLKQQGVGLGLAIVARIMDLHHGGMDVHNKQPQGLCVALTFPICSL